MPDVLNLRVGESRQLRPPPEGVGRWTSNAPAVASVTDEDLVANRPGGLIVAIKAGRTRITAFGFDNATRVFELDVQVEAAQEATVVRVARNETAALPDVAGVTGWVIANRRVAEPAEDGRVRGLVPGITAARPAGGGTAECVIEVTGSLDVGVGQTVSLAEFFSPAVKSWRTSCPSEVTVDDRGTVATGDRPRTVEVYAELATGRTFAFSLRIMAVPRAQAPAAAPATQRAGSARTPPPPDAAPPVVPPALRSDQRQTVDSLLQAAEAHIASQDWVQAGSEITAARLAAAADPDLSQRVDQLSDQLRASVRQRAGAMIAEAIRLIVAGECDRARQHLESARVPREWQPLVETVRRLATLSDTFASDADDRVRHDMDLEVEAAWDGLVRYEITAPLPMLGNLGLGCGHRIVPLMLDALCSPALTGMPASTRQALGEAAGAAGPVAVEVVITRLADDRTSPGAVSALLALMPDLPLQQSAACIVTFYRNAGATARARLVERIAALHTNASGALFDLLAGVLNRMPPDPSFARAVQARIRAESGPNRDELETAARVWAARRHRNAQIVLQRLYDYDSGAFLR